MATTEAIAPTITRARPAAGLWRDAWGRLRKNELAMIGFVMVVLLIIIAIIGPYIAPYPYQQQDLKAVVANGNKALPPGSPGHLFGTDVLGRDLLSRLLDGARISMTVALVAQVVVLLIGVPIGAIAGWVGGRTDNLLMRFTDVMYAFPDLLFIILLSVAFRETAFGKALDGLLLVFVAIGLTIWVTVARLVRGQMLALKETEFVEAAKAIALQTRRSLGEVVSELARRGLKPRPAMRGRGGVPVFEVSERARPFGPQAVRQALDDEP